jgi:GTP-binding protein LepA
MAASFRSRILPSCRISKVEEIREPIITTTIFVPQDYLGNVITLCNQKRGNQVDLHYHGRQVKVVYDMPMAEVVMDFFDKLKSVLPRLCVT